MAKIFKNFDQQIQLLESMGLTIDNYDKLKWYLKAYNYQNIINGYNDFFMVNNDRKNNCYKQEATSNSIIELFNFDRSISTIILSSIQNIERMISTALAYTIAEILNKNNINNGQIFNIKTDDIIIKKIFITRNDKNVFFNVYETFKKSYDDNNDKNKSIFQKYNHFQDIPIWCLLLRATFGNIIYFLKTLKENIFFEVMKNSTLKNWERLNKGEIINLLTILKDIRNRICHNNVLYKISISDQAKRIVIKKIINEKDCSHNSKMKLYEIVKAIEKLDPNAKNYYSNKISNKFNEFKYINKCIIDEIKENIWNKN